MKGFKVVPIKFKNPDSRVFEELGLPEPKDEDYVIAAKVRPEEVQLYYTNYSGSTNFVLRGDPSPYTALVPESKFELIMFGI